jgi:hypothetical protein
LPHARPPKVSRKVSRMAGARRLAEKK